MAPLAVDGMHTNFMILHEKVIRYLKELICYYIYVPHILYIYIYTTVASTV